MKQLAIRLAFTVMVCTMLASCAPVCSAPVEIKMCEAQLFVDDYLIAAQENLHRTLIQPAKDDDSQEAILSFDDLAIEDAGTLEANGSIAFDPELNKYVMLALAYRTRSDWMKTQLYRFTSDDGINWTVGDDGTPQPVFPMTEDDLYDEASGLRATNIDLFSFYYDTADEETPYKGWVWLANMGDKEGLYYISSPDGITWDHGQMVMSIHDFHFQHDGWELFGAGDVSIFTPDPDNDRFLALIKLANHEAIGPGNRQRARTFMYVDKLDARIDPTQVQRADLVPPALSLNGDLPGDEYYSSTAWRHSSSLWVGALKIWHGGGDYTYSPNGCAFFKFVTSRDGIHWEKTQFPNDENTMEVWVPNGVEGGNDGKNDGGYMTEFSQGPLRIGNELIYYYGSSSWGKNHARGVRVSGGGIFRARIRPDGYVAVDGGSVTTKPLVCEGGGVLFINGVGPIEVDVIQGGKPVAQATVEGDALAHEVSFDTVTLADVIKGKPYQLRFTVPTGGQLFSFTIR